MPDAMPDRPTHLLRFGPALLKLELLQPGRAVRTAPPIAEARAGVALAAAALRGGLVVVPRGVFTHEVRETLVLWGARLDATARGAQAVAQDCAALCAELLEELAAPPSQVVAPAGDLPALVSVLAALRARWPGLRGVALAGAGAVEELPDLPAVTDVLASAAAAPGSLPEGVEIVAVTRAQAAAARVRLARELGLLAGHASAAAAMHAHANGGLALLFTPGEREFSLDRA